MVGLSMVGLGMVGLGMVSLGMVSLSMGVVVVSSSNPVPKGVDKFMTLE